MALKLRPAGLGDGIDKDRQDYTVRCFPSRGHALCCYRPQEVLCVRRVRYPIAELIWPHDG